jgi:hypothetical protein
MSRVLRSMHDATVFEIDMEPDTGTLITVAGAGVQSVQCMRIYI